MLEIYLYLLPMIIDSTNPDRPVRRPAYIADIMLENRERTIMPYGREDVCFLAILWTQEENDSLMTHADVNKVPDTLDAQLGGAGANAVKARLAELNIPDNWVQASDTWRDVVRVTMRIFQFSQRVAGLGHTRLFPPGVTLNTQYKDLPQAYQQVLQDAAASFGWDTSGLTQNSTMRNILKTLSDQWGETPITLGSFTF